MGEFIDIVCTDDTALRPLIRKQAEFMRRRYQRVMPAPGPTE